MKVKVIRQNDQTALVEYDDKGTPQRCLIPVDKIIDGSVTPYVLDMGTPYGDDLVKDFRAFTVKAADITRLLHEQGVFTLEELKAAQDMFIKMDVNPFLQIRIKLAGLYQSVKE